MKLTAAKRLAIGAAAVVAAAGFSSVALAQGRGPDQQTPKGWTYEIKNGQRVPKANRVTNQDGSWREELRQGNCVTVKERAATGEYKETRQCNPRTPS
jgi:hypothetical protein